jgi:hypothetical protein
MRFKIQVSIENGNEQTSIEDIVCLERTGNQNDFIGLSLQESKSILKELQKKLVLGQAGNYIQTRKNCTKCDKPRRIKRHRTIQYRTLFGIVTIPDTCFYNCDCIDSPEKTSSLLKRWLPDHTSPELLYIETKWASLMSYGLTASLLKDILPISHTQNAATVQNHLHKIAKRQESELENKPNSISGCQRDWGNLPKPNKPITVGIDGGYIRNWHQKNTNFEIIVGKSFSKTANAKRFGMVQKLDNNPKRRLMHVLNEQGMQTNQQITFLSDGAENVRDLQYMMYPESEHVLDWFHVTMRLTVLNQFAKGFVNADPSEGAQVKKKLESIKWYL